VSISTATSAVSAAVMSSGSTSTSSSPRSRHRPSAMYRSVGKLLRSLTTRLRAGLSSRAMLSAALSTLYRLMEVLSVHTTSSLPAPMKGASWLPRRCGRSNQLAVFHERIRSVPHSRVTTSATRAAAALGSTPSELPSR